MNNVHFAIPEIYGDSLSYYELLRKLVNKMNELIENYNTVPEQIAEEVKKLDAYSVFTTALNWLIHSIATDNTKSKDAVKQYKKHDLLYATFNDNVNLYEAITDFTNVFLTELKVGENIREVNISELIIELRKLIDNEAHAREQADKTLQTNIEKLKVYVTPEMFGAVGDGVADDTEALIRAIYAANELNTELRLYKKYKISNDVELPKKLGVLGCVSPKATIISDNKSKIYVRGGGDDLYFGKIENVKFDYVQLIFGENTDDYGNQYIMRDCEFRGKADTNFNSITLKNNCWNMIFDNVINRNVGIAFLLNFTDKVNSGACVKFNNCSANDGLYGCKVEGVCADGGDIWFVNCNFEHNDYGYYFDDNTNGLYAYVVNTHFESNRVCGCYSSGANVSLNGGWGFYDPSVSSFDSLFHAKNAEMFVQNMRINSGDKKYYHTEGTGVIYIGDNVIAPPESYYNNGGRGTNRYSLKGNYKVSKRYTIKNERFNSIDTQNAINPIRISGSIYVPGGAVSTNDIVFINEGGGSPRVLNIPISDTTKNMGGNINFEININKNNIFAIFNDVNGQKTTIKTVSTNINEDIAQSYYFTDENQNKNIDVTYIIGN